MGGNYALEEELESRTKELEEALVNLEDIRRLVINGVETQLLNTEAQGEG